MNFNDILSTLSGATLLKLILALIAASIFLLERKKDSEGLVLGLAVLLFFYALRDCVFAFLPLDGFFRLTDMLAFGALLYVCACASGGPSWPVWLILGADGLAVLYMFFGGLLGLLPYPESGDWLLLTALIPLAGIWLPAGKKNSPDEMEELPEPGSRPFSKALRLPLTIGGLLYLGLEALLGPQTLEFQEYIVPAWYIVFLFCGYHFNVLIEKSLRQSAEKAEYGLSAAVQLLEPPPLKSQQASEIMQSCLDSMLGVAVERSGADGGAIFLMEEFEDTISIRSMAGVFSPPFKLPESLPKGQDRVSAYLRHIRFKVGEGLLGGATKSGRPLFIRDAASDSEIFQNGKDQWLRVSSLIIVPLIVAGRSLGILIVEKNDGSMFGDEDYSRVVQLSTFISGSVAKSLGYLQASDRSEIDREASIAVGIQRMVEPKAFPDIAGLSFGGFTRPAWGVCSDYYDCIQTRADRVVLALGDVAGKGVQAGLVMAMMRAILHLITNSTKDTATLLSWVNRGITGQVDVDHFATLGLVTVNAGSGEVEFANAAEQPVLVFRQSTGQVETVDIKSIPIGVERTTAYSQKNFRLNPGDVIVLYSDGLVEAMDDQSKQYGRQRLGATVAKSSSLAAGGIAEAVRKDVERFVGPSPQHDDQTVLVMKAGNL